MATQKFIARFKYANALTSAKHFAKNVFAEVTPDDAAARSAKAAPLDWAANDLGYVSYNKTQHAKRA